MLPRPSAVIQEVDPSQVVAPFGSFAHSLSTMYEGAVLGQRARHGHEHKEQFGEAVFLHAFTPDLQILVYASLFHKSWACHSAQIKIGDLAGAYVSS